MLAIAIGACTAIFSVLNRVLLQPLPYPDDGRLVVVEAHHRELESSAGFVSPLDFDELRASTKSFEALSAWQRSTSTLTGLTRPRRVEALLVSDGFFSVMGLPVQHGRAFVSEEDAPDGPRAVVLSDGYWKRNLGADPNVVGSLLILDGESHTVVGIAHPELRFTRDVEIWLPLRLQPERWPRGFRYLGVVGRVSAQSSLEAAQEELAAFSANQERVFPAESTGWKLELQRLRDRMVNRVRSTLWVLFSAVVAVLAIAGTNVANLLMFRGWARRHELAVRRSLGARPFRLFGQLVLDAFLIALLGGLGGLSLATLFVTAIPKLAPANFPRSAEISLDPWIVCFSLLLVFAVTTVFGAVPAIRVVRLSANTSLRSGGRSSFGSQDAGRARLVLVAGEVALALVLVITASLFLRSLNMLIKTDPGFQTAHLSALELELPAQRYDRPAQGRLLQDFVEQLAAMPGVDSIGAVHPLPLSGGSPARFAFSVEGQHTAVGDLPEVPIWTASPGYFKTMGIPLLSGRTFSVSDQPGTEPVAVVNRTFVERHLGGGEAVGLTVTLGSDPSSENAFRLRIVGVVGATRHDQLIKEPEPQLYYSNLQFPFRFTTLVVRSALDTISLTASIAAVAKSLDPALPVADLQTIEEIVVGSLARRIFTTRLITGFAALSLVLAMSGVFAVLAYSIGQRTRELGLRLALGASQKRLLSQLVREGMAPVVAGFIVGGIVSIVVARLFQSHFHGVEATDPMSFIGGGAILLAVALLASVAPSLRVMSIAPANLLREE
jgi:putative ABC transport system permease protein